MGLSYRAVIRGKHSSRWVGRGKGRAAAAAAAFATPIAWGRRKPFARFGVV